MRRENICHLAARISKSDEPITCEKDVQYYTEGYGGIQNEIFWDHSNLYRHENISFCDIECMNFWMGIFPIFYDRFVKSKVVKNMKEAKLIVEGSGPEIEHMVMCLQAFDENLLARAWNVGEIEFKENNDIEGFVLKCEPSQTPACARCRERVRYGWPLRPQVGVTKEFPDLCFRCAKVIKDKKEKGELVEV